MCRSTGAARVLRTPDRRPGRTSSRTGSSDPRYSDAYVLITRAQKIAVDSEQYLPPGSLDRVETALRSSPKFRVAYDTTDAVVFVLTSRRGHR